MTESIVEYQNKYSRLLLESKNVIFRGAPGTGKSFLAKEIAADIVSGGKVSRYSDLSLEQKEQIEFVQFHPSYDYSDFVEGLRPVPNGEGTMTFALRDGVFKKFVLKAIKNKEDSQKSIETLKKERSAQEAINDFLDKVELEREEFQTAASGTKFFITGYDDTSIYIRIPENPVIKSLVVSRNELSSLLEADQEFKQVKEIKDFFGKKNNTQQHSYDLALWKEIRKLLPKSKKDKDTTIVKEKHFIFIIDEINRGEISKIFGELFFAIDPGYRGMEGAVSTQYTNLHDNPDEKFYIPDNVYIIGTMNDIDRSVDSFDFAMRRRFRFVNIKAEERIQMLDELLEQREEAITRMNALNNAISNTDELNDNYHIGAAYFLKLKDIGFEELWNDYLAPLLQDYIRGMYNESELMEQFKRAYDLGIKDEAVEN